ncbi:MAG: putative oxidoreductase [Actinomycetia bacterium]|jgi:flavin reductase (DIM6/NTAB) family NADH-FMN oxidoreductase RutF|nr:putative oxidoreductase [Actinomycetes bacterium]
MSASPGEPRAFHRIVAELDYPMIIATTADGTERAGCLIGFSTQCSIKPPRYAVLISTKNRTAEVAVRAEIIVVHILRPGDKPLARVFGEETGDDVPKFDQCSWKPGPGGVPVIDDCDWFAGRIMRRVDVGDHVLHALDVIDEGDATRAERGQLGFQAVRDLHAGHMP